ncbi:MAG: DUF2971 domain-containing protein [Terracidiphilus sp.]|jgi:hypothetical protein
MSINEAEPKGANSSETVEDPLLYHYTTLEAFTGILRDGVLWASHIRYLNDTSEQRMMWELILKRIEERLRDTSDPYREKLADLKAVATNAQDEHIYVISFSEVGGDDLSQWRGYGANAGISVGFKKAELRRVCGNFTTAQHKPPIKRGGAMLKKVQYVDPKGDEESNKIVDLFLDRGLPESLGSEFSPEQAFVRQVSMFSSTLKHKAFSAEQEWRIVVIDLKGGSAPKIRARKSLFVPYIELDIHDSDPSKIFVGPSPNKENTVAAIKHFCATRDSSDIEVIPSQLPFRDY